ncbi:MAG: hypothetical protein DRP02_02275 [Candidatus Gerdarchaeota archaeon]|nr:MAG: hypothetical protein DRP02_02275 [Candidatus Gerdarchaeota archaeon]
MKHSNKTYKIFTDGATKGFNGKLGTVSVVGLGVYIPHLGVDGKKYCKKMNGISNNEAEFKALIYGMEKAIEKGIKKAAFFLDSKIVVSRANGQRARGKWANARMDAFQDQVAELEKEFEEITFAWIPREQNWMADKLSKEGIYGKVS